MKTDDRQAKQLDDVLRAEIARAAADAFDLDQVPVVELSESRERGHGDLASNLALKLAKMLKRSPRDVATALVERLDLDRELVERVEIAGPGFINFHLAGTFVQAQVGAILDAGERFGRSSPARAMRYQVEFVSANPTGPLNVVSARAAAVGDTLVRMLRAAGHQVEAEFYVNDAGRQVDLLAESLDARWLESAGHVAAIPDEGYQGEYIIDLARAIAAERSPESLDAEERRRIFREEGVARLLGRQETDLQQFGVVFDRWFRESSLHASGALERAKARLESAGHVAEREGATWFLSEALGDDADRVIVRSDGRPTYLLADIAYHADKHERGFEHVIDVWGPDHHGHIARMQAAAQSLGFGPDWLEILIVQQVNLLRGGEPVKMSKRAGEFITLNELEDEVGVDPARFFFLMRRTGAHLDFDLDLAKQQTDENPCFYVQYGHARIASVLDHARERGQELRPIADVDLTRLEDGAELALIKRLASMPEVVRGCASSREPQRMTAYLRDVAADFHRFYHHNRVVGVEEELSQARLALVRATQVVLQNGLELIGLSAPERM